MPARIPTELRLQVIMLWIQGYSYEQIAIKISGASLSSARNIVDELKAGKFPEYSEFIPYLDDMHRLGQQLLAKGMTLQQALTGAAVVNALNELGLEPGNILAALSLVKRLAPLGYPAQEVLQAGLRIQKLESKTGIGFEDLAQDYERRLEELRNLEQKKHELGASIESAEHTLEDKLQTNKATQELLDEFVHFRKGLAEIGINIDQGLKPAAVLIRRVRDEGLERQLKELCILESQSGMSPEKILQESQQNILIIGQQRRRLDNLREKRKRARKELGQLKMQIAGTRRILAHKLASANLARGQLSRYSRLICKLRSLGLLPRLEKLRRFMLKVERSGYKPSRIVKLFEKEDSLRLSIDSLSREHSALEETVAERKQILEGLNNQISQSRVELGRLENQQEQMRNETEKMRDQIEFSDALKRLLEDPSTAIDFHLNLLDIKLRIILDAREIARATGYEMMDYNGLRWTARALVERVLGCRLS